MVVCQAGADYPYRGNRWNFLDTEESIKRLYFLGDSSDFKISMEKDQPGEYDKTAGAPASRPSAGGRLFQQPGTSRYRRYEVWEAHRGRGDSAPENTIADELKQNLKKVGSLKGSRAEQLLMVFCKQTKLRYNKLTEEEKQWLTRIVPKSKLAKGSVPQRGKRKKVGNDKRNFERKMLVKNIFIHGSGHKSTSWDETISYMKNNKDILCPNLSSLLNGKEASYHNLYSLFAEYCNQNDGQINLCGISLGGILSLNYTLDFPDKVKSLVLIGTPHKIPQVLFSIQNIVFRFLPKSMFEDMAFNKKDTFILGNSMKELDFSNSVHRIKCPTLVICGKKDRANIKSAYYLIRNMQNAKLKIIEKTGHVVNEENPKILAKILSEYYNGTKSNTPCL